jgi:Tol biopolymer transport system component
VRPDGTGLHTIATDLSGTVSQQHSDWSPDGQHIVFEGSTQDSSISLWTADADGSHATKIAECPVPACKQYAYPAWSHDGTTIAFIRFDVLPNGDWGPNAVEVLDLASHRVSVVKQLPNGATAFAEAPRWSPDDRRLVVGVETYDGPAENTVTSERLAVLAVGGKPSQTLTFITAPGLWASTPDWHPTQDLIAFNTRNLDAFGDDPVAMNIWTVKSDGRGLTQLTRESTDGAVKIADPTWTPDGTQLLVVVKRDTKTLAFLPASGGTPKELSIEGAHARLRPTPK